MRPITNSKILLIRRQLRLTCQLTRSSLRFHFTRQRGYSRPISLAIYRKQIKLPTMESVQIRLLKWLTTVLPIILPSTTLDKVSARLRYKPRIRIQRNTLMRLLALSNWKVSYYQSLLRIFWKYIQTNPKLNLVTEICPNARITASF